MKRLLLIGFGAGALLVTSQSAEAGVKVSVNLGFPAYRHCGPSPRIVYRSHCGPVYHHRSYSCGYSRRVVYVQPEPVVIMQSPPPVYYNSAPVYSSSPTPAPTEVSRTFYQLGHDWAKDLRNDIATWDQFVTYLKANISRADVRDYNDFRDGFVSTYGVNGQAAFDKAFQQARAG
jgi:hypothetical protein